MGKRFLIKQSLLIGALGLTSSCSYLIPSIALMPGRPLRVEGEALSAEIGQAGSHWAKGQRPDTSQLDEPTRLALEALWLQDARGEHASIPAFSRLSWQLTSLGAPSELIEKAHQAALEEIGHARLCFGLAEGYGNRSHFVQPIPAMKQTTLDVSIEALTAETIFDGCLVEGFFAKLVQKAAEACEEPAALAALEQIAQEEKSHADFSWQILEWLLSQHQVQSQAQAALDDLENHPRPNVIRDELKSLVKKADPKLLAKHGRVPENQWQEIWDDHLAETQLRLKNLLKEA